MIKNKTGLTLVLLLLLCGLAFQAAKSVGKELVDSDKKSGIDWHTFDQGMTKAIKEKKLLVVDFYTDWCHWCKVMDKETYGNSDVINYAKKNVIMAKINAETTERFEFQGNMYAGRELSMMFGVRGFPATAFFTKEGEFITVISGYIPADRFNVIVKYLAEGWYEKMKFEEFEKQETANG